MKIKLKLRWNKFNVITLMEINVRSPMEALNKQKTQTQLCRYRVGHI